MSTIGSEKFSNNEYAPGIAVYGIDGKDGVSGQDGTTVFVSQYSISDGDSDGISSFGTAILQNLNMSINSTDKLARSYIEGDCFLFSNATIWKITDLSGLKTAAASNQLTSLEEFSKYMTQVGEINTTSTNTGFTEGNRLVLDTNLYQGLFINNISDISEDSIDTTAPLVVASNKTNNDDTIQLLNLKSIFTGTDESEFNIYYDTNNDAFHIDSDKPILIDTDVMFTTTDAEEFDEYSQVLTSDNTITSFRGICGNITFAKELVAIQDDVEYSVNASTIEPDGVADYCVSGRIISLPDEMLNIGIINVLVADTGGNCSVIRYNTNTGLLLSTAVANVAAGAIYYIDNEFNTSQYGKLYQCTYDSSTGTYSWVELTDSEGTVVLLSDSDEDNGKRVKLTLTNANSSENTVPTYATIHISASNSGVVQKEYFVQLDSEAAFSDDRTLSVYINGDDVETMYEYTWRVSIISGVEIYISEN